GDDIYYVDSANDIVEENINGGIDSVYASVDYTLSSTLENLTLTGDVAINGVGNALNNTIRGNNANNLLLGGEGDNFLYGFGGNDSLESGTGKDRLYGGDGNDTLISGAGNDILDGGTGNDSLVGGDGDDIYYVDSANDIVEENINAGIDSVYASVDYTLSLTLENLTFTGDVAINAVGNALNNIIRGNNANNLLLGGDGNDYLFGGIGNDSLLGENGNDYLSGDIGNDYFVGGDGNDSLLGGNDNDFLVGGAGNDYLLGGTGNDHFVYNLNAAFNSNSIGVDTIADFTLNTDKIVLYKNTFAALKSNIGDGFSVSSEFTQVTNDTAAAISSAMIVYNSANGKLFYNENGAVNGFGTGAQFATLANHPSLLATDFLIQ
ncbi:hypothetical protein BV372_34655, partial [Nostoc sp. T09]|uniref:calcium-binding protein n=1 Tax=Nostoc sp. T09 TaxID=1932621 RepID=UPI000B690D19